MTIKQLKDTVFAVMNKDIKETIQNLKNEENQNDDQNQQQQQDQLPGLFNNGCGENITKLLL